MHYSDEELRYIMQSHMQNATNNIDDNMLLNGSKSLRPFRKDNKLKVTRIKGLVWRSSLFPARKFQQRLCTISKTNLLFYPLHFIYWFGYYSNACDEKS